MCKSKLIIILLLLAGGIQAFGQDAIDHDERYAYFADSLFKVKGKRESAIDLTKDPTSPEGKIKITQLNDSIKGLMADIKKILNTGLSKYPEDSDLKMLKGRYLYERKEYDSARYELIKALEYNPNNAEARRILASVEMTTGRYSSAICYINELLELTPYDKSLWLLKIECYRLEGNFVEADRMLTRICQIYPEDAHLKKINLFVIEEQLYNALKDSTDVLASIELAARLVAQDPKNQEYHLFLVNSYLKNGNYEAALASTQKGLYHLPESLALIRKKAEILEALYRYNEAIDFLRNEMKKSEPRYKFSYRDSLQRQYNYLVEISARYQRKSDPYGLYWEMLQQNPLDTEAFNYTFHTALYKGLHEDALNAINLAREAGNKRNPANKEQLLKNLLLKERLVYVNMGRLSKADQVTEQLYAQYPGDTDILSDYTQLILRRAKIEMDEGRYNDALVRLKFVAEHGDNEQVKSALVAMFNCNNQLGRRDAALVLADRLAREYPAEWEWHARKATIYKTQGKYMDALTAYEKGLERSEPDDRGRALEGYDELATISVKQLIEEYRLDEALGLVEHWLEVNPESVQGARYAVNIATQMDDYSRMEKYAALGLKHSPDDAFFKGKLAEAKFAQKKYSESFRMLTPEVALKPYHKGLVGAYSQAGEGYAKQLINQKKYDESLQVLDSALRYDRNNRDLKYWKGVAYEKLRLYDSAHIYQSLYDPSPGEAREFYANLRYMKNKTYKNRIMFGHMRGKYGDSYITRGLSTLEYNRLEEKNTYTGTVNYTGREDGKGIQGLFEWTHDWTPTLYSRINVGGANKYFPAWLASASVYKQLGSEWELELGAGYRRLEIGELKDSSYMKFPRDPSGALPAVLDTVITSKQNMVQIVAGISKGWDPWWLNVRVNGVVNSSKWYYNIFAQGRYYFYNPACYIVAMGSFGSAPDISVIVYNLYNGLSASNAMVGLGVNWLLTERCTGNITGTWYNYKISDPYEQFKFSPYRNLFNLSLNLFVSF